MSFELQVIQSELKMMLSKEREMRELYDRILKNCENEYICKRIRAIRDDEKKHMGYVKIMTSLLGINSNNAKSAS